MKKSGNRATFRHKPLEIPAPSGPSHLLPLAPGDRPQFGDIHNHIEALEIVYANIRV